jgi:hypothetical protein
MCDVSVIGTEQQDGTIVASVICKITGKPVVYTDVYGMFCEDRCQYEECKRGHDQLKTFISSLEERFLQEPVCPEDLRKFLFGKE